MSSEQDPERSVATEVQSELLRPVKKQTMSKLKIQGKELRAIGYLEVTYHHH